MECALCYVAINEVEGFLAENITEAEIEDLLRNQVCTELSPELQVVCDGVADNLDKIVQDINDHVRVGIVCEDLGFCDSTHGPFPDPFSIPTYVINLDLPPKQRWKEIYSLPQYKSIAQSIYQTVMAVTPTKLMNVLSDMGLLVLSHLPQEFADEIRGGAEAFDIPASVLTLLNLGYELTDDCTSIVAQTQDGKIIHARNLDFGAGMAFTDDLRNMTVQVEFQTGGKTVYRGITFVGFVGLLSGIKPGGFSVTVDTRSVPAIWDMLENLVEAIVLRGAAVNSFLIRQVLLSKNSYTEALNIFSNNPLIAPVYLILAGANPGEGAVITRNWTAAVDVWSLDPSSNRWYVLETNYDHWEEPPWYDERRYYANEGMQAMGQAGLSMDGLLKVLSIKPVLNRLTTYSVLMIPKDDYIKGYGRYCNDPCPT